jgi:hypothetical protein
MLNRRTSLDRKAKHTAVIVIDSSDSDSDSDFDSDFGFKERKRVDLKRRTRSSISSSSPSSSSQVFDQLLNEDSNNDEHEDNEEKQMEKAIVESLRLAEIETQNRAYEQAVVEDTIFKIKTEERKARETRYQRAGSRVFNQTILPHEPTVSITVLSPSSPISKVWLTTTPCKTLLEWVSTELINAGEEYMEDEIQLVDRISPGYKITYDSELTLAMAGFTEPTVLIAQYLPHSPKINKKQRI